MTDTLLNIDIPRSAICPHYVRGKLIQCHEQVPMRRRKGEPHQRWRCRNCGKEIRWEHKYHVYVLPYLIEEEELPW